ncbi:restriction endonuclease [Streptomyces sp. AGS-58]|uniref:restriction endonuclease n=2 Tax=unclassified Streptomyces TaxID=2593676 RepID=UPI0035A2754C
MTMPVRRMSRPTGGTRRPFDLRATALFFAVLALALCVLGFAARTAASAAERRPVWVAVLCLLAVSAALALRRRRRRLSPARTAQRAAAALEEAAHTALEELEAPAPVAPAAFVPRQAGAAGPDLSSPAGLHAPDTVDYGALDPDAFEQAVAALCERDGCTAVEVVGGAGDLGADVLAVAPDGRRLVVQCKRYGDANRVGSQDLQRFGGTCYTVHEADVAVLVTTSDFTAPAVEYAEQCGILCLNRAALDAWSDGTGPAPWMLVDVSGPC